MKKVLTERLQIPNEFVFPLSLELMKSSAGTCSNPTARLLNSQLIRHGIVDLRELHESGLFPQICSDIKSNTNKYCVSPTFATVSSLLFKYTITQVQPPAVIRCSVIVFSNSVSSMRTSRSKISLPIIQIQQTYEDERSAE